MYIYLLKEVTSRGSLTPEPTCCGRSILGGALLLGQAPPVHIDLLCEPEYKQVYADIESWLTERI